MRRVARDSPATLRKVRSTARSSPYSTADLTSDSITGQALERYLQRKAPPLMDKLTSATPAETPATLDLDVLKGSLTMAQRNGRACVRCGSSDYSLKPAGMLLDIALVECDFHGWELRDKSPAAWLTKPCPAWCTEQHRTSEHPDDRQHLSVMDSVDLLTMAFEDCGAPDKPDYQPLSLMTELVQGHLEAEPRVCLHDTSDKGPANYLSLAEARELVENLTKLITRGETSS